MRKRAGFTLVELVIVILILGILATVAAPSLFNASGTAMDNSLKQSLKVIRDAIEMYSAHRGGQLPGVDNLEDTFKADLEPFLRTFPANPAGANPSKLDQVRIVANGSSLDSQVDNEEGWIYNSETGEFRANSDHVTQDGGDVYFNF